MKRAMGKLDAARKNLEAETRRSRRTRPGAKCGACGETRSRIIGNVVTGVETEVCAECGTPKV